VLDIIHFPFNLMHTKTIENIMGKNEQKPELEPEPRKNELTAALNKNSNNIFGETTPAVEVQPVVLQYSLDRPLKSCNPIVIDMCLKKYIGDCDACLPRQNCNLAVKCKGF